MADYVKNEVLLETLLEYRKTKSKKLYNELGKMCILIATRQLYQTKFINYSKDMKDSAISDACLYMLKYCIPGFNEKLSKYPNPFAYFTQTAKNAMKQNINKYKLNEERNLSLDFIDNFNENGIGTSSDNYKVDSQIMNSMTQLGRDV